MPTRPCLGGTRCVDTLRGQRTLPGIFEPLGQWSGNLCLPLLVNFLGLGGAVVHPLVRSFSGQRVVSLHSFHFLLFRPIVFDSGRERWSLRLGTILVSRSIDGSFVS